MGLVADPVLLLLRGRAVMAKAIRLDHEPEIGPVEADLESVHPLPRSRRLQPGPAHEPQESPLELGVGEREDAPVEDLAERRDTGDAGVPGDLRPQRFRIDQAELVRLVDGGLELFGRENSSQIDKGPGRTGDWDAIAPGSVPAR